MIPNLKTAILPLRGTAGGHVGEVTTPQDSTALSKAASIGAHVSEIAQPAFCPARSAEELLAVHPVDDTIWSHSNPSEVSIDEANSAELIVGIHITEGLTYAFERSDPYGLLTRHHTCHTRMICHGMMDQHSLTDLLTQTNQWTLLVMMMS